MFYKSWSFPLPHSKDDSIVPPFPPSVHPSIYVSPGPTPLVTSFTGDILTRTVQTPSRSWVLLLSLPSRHPLLQGRHCSQPRVKKRVLSEPSPHSSTHRTTLNPKVSKRDRSENSDLRSPYPSPSLGIIPRHLHYSGSTYYLYKSSVSTLFLGPCWTPKDRTRYPHPLPRRKLTLPLSTPISSTSSCYSSPNPFAYT